MYAYNPRKKTAEQLESSLVGADRHDILNGILFELALKNGESPKQHWMIVGARGMGKSHLLTLLHHKVCTDNELSARWIPVLFPEEIRMAGDLARFLERAVTEILHDMEREKSKIASDLKEKIARIRSIRHDERVDYLFSVITWIRSETGRHILLIAENLQQLLGKKISLIDQKRLRAYLQSEDALLLIGSATTIFDALHDHSHPFYHFFHIRRLNELSFEDVKALVANLLSGYGREEQARIMLENEARLKVLHSFTGGNPRMAVFLSDILKTDVNEEMIDIMDRILDELTPYFEAIINDTPEYLQDIINCLAAFEPAQSPKEIAEHLEMEQGTVRNYLKQAKDAGYVRVAFSKGKSNFYCLNEYLYRTWFQMRDSGHREEMRWLMELMLLLYSREQIMEENRRIEAAVGGGSNHYHQLVKQTCEFMVMNPSFCAVIELCAQQVGIAKRKVNTSRKLEKKFEKEIKKQLTGLDVADMSRRDYMNNLSRIMVDTLSKVGSGPIVQLVSYSNTIPLYFKNTLDIATAMQDYDKHITPVKLQHYRMLTDVIDSEALNSDEFATLRLLLHVALGNYDRAVECATALSPDANDIRVILTLNLLIIQTIYHCHTANIEQVTHSCDALVTISRITNHKGMKYFLLPTLLLAYRAGTIQDDVLLMLYSYAKENHPVDMSILKLWICFQAPESEAAQKMLTNPAIAQTVAKINELIANVMEEKQATQEVQS